MSEEDEKNIEQGQDNPEEQKGDSHQPLHLDGMYQNWFLDYASYVILERAVPEVADGLKPVQRRILHAMKDLDDGRFNKVANIIGHTMQYHPHGDASIGDALVQLGQKDLLVETQGNWGNILTGDSAAAPRYIEARLSKFALDVLFNAKTTTWKKSYDGRKKEPISLPAKFPLLLAQGVEGIAVGLSSKILPHNFNELIDASINILQGKEFEIYPDFPSGGQVDVTKYNDGERGGKVRVRARIRKEDKKTLVVTELPFGLTTTSLIDSIVAANDKKKIKVKRIDDNTAEKVEIVIQLAPGVSPDQTIDALYAFTQCEISISPNACIIDDGTPKFMDVKEILRISTQNTLGLLKKELEIRLAELKEDLHFASLEKIFIENKIYRRIENAKTWEGVLSAIRTGLKPFKEQFIREVTEEDILRLTEIRIKRISKYNSDKADEQIANIVSEIEETENHLEHIVGFTINYFKQIRKKYGKGRERKTEIRNFDNIEAAMVAVANEKLYINREEGFAGTSLKKAEYVCDCSDIDDIIVFRADGTMMVTRVDSKFYVGKDVLHLGVFKKNDDRTIYNMIYRDGKRGHYYVKRFPVGGITRDKEYHLTKGTEGSKVIYFTVNPNGEAEVIKVYLRPRPRMKKTSFEFDFSTLAIKGRNSQGNILTKNPVKSIVKREEGVSTLGAIDIWYDDTVKRLNSDERGKYLGAFKEDDKILVVTESGHYRFYGYDLSTHFDDQDVMLIIEKFNPEKIYTAIYLDGESGFQYIKRFVPELTDKKVDFLNDHPESNLLHMLDALYPRVEVTPEDRKDGKPREKELIDVDGFIAVKGVKAKGKRLLGMGIKEISILEPGPEDGEIGSDEGQEEEKVTGTENPEVENTPEKDKAVPPEESVEKTAEEENTRSKNETTKKKNKRSANKKKSQAKKTGDNTDSGDDKSPKTTSEMPGKKSSNDQEGPGNKKDGKPGQIELEF